MGRWVAVLLMLAALSPATAQETPVRGGTLVFGVIGTVGSAWNPMPSQVEPLASPPCHTNTLEPIGRAGSLMVAAPSATISAFCST